jgi:serine-type D-Ala-D-Ala carboxypeptidase
MLGRAARAPLALAIAATLAAAPACAQPVTKDSPGSALEAALHDTLRAVLERARADSAFPGAFAAVGNRNGVLAMHGVGALDWKPSPRPDEHTLWDLASLTKVVGMTTAMMQLVEQGKVDLDAPVQRYLPRFTGPGKDAVRVRHLLTHSSGLPSWRAIYKEATSPDAALALVYATPLDTAPGVRYVYSDLGAILLGQIVERVSGEALDRYLEGHVFRPLGMTETMYRPPAALRERIAPTEVDPWRQRHLRGEVHDENAFALGGVSGHAGLFSSGHDMARFARMLLGGGQLGGVRVVPAATLRRFTEPQDTAVSRRGLGWETATGDNSGGHRLSSRAFGHTGFTGTSLWVDPERDVFIILLTNRVNPTRENRKIGAVRVRLADAVMAALGGPATSTRRP